MRLPAASNGVSAHYFGSKSEKITLRDKNLSLSDMIGGILIVTAAVCLKKTLQRLSYDL